MSDLPQPAVTAAALETVLVPIVLHGLYIINYVILLIDRPIKHSLPLTTVDHRQIYINIYTLFLKPTDAKSPKRSAKGYNFKEDDRKKSLANSFSIP